jgi:hypothetical protein
MQGVDPVTQAAVISDGLTDVIALTESLPKQRTEMVKG